MDLWKHAVVATCLMAVGCDADTNNDTTPPGAGIATLGGSTGADTDGGAATSPPTTGLTEGGSGDSSDGDGGGADDGPKFDLGDRSDVMIADACQAVDFLFVIDNSVSMGDQQAALKAAFPGFMDTIQNTLPTTDYHIMVVDTDADGRCSPGTCSHATCQEAMQYACGNQFVACDTTRGAGVIHPAGEEASNMLCTPFGGNRYIVEGEPDLDGTFSCMASVGLAGNASERPMDGMVEAVGAAINGPGGCNDGFLRQDAILVVTFLSDDPNVEDQNDAQQTYDALVAAKGGNADSIVMLGLTPGFEGCSNNAGQHWADMIGLFGDRGFQGSICEADYSGFFTDAVSIIEDTCLDFEG